MVKGQRRDKPVPLGDRTWYVWQRPLEGGVEQSSTIALARKHTIQTQVGMNTDWVGNVSRNVGVLRSHHAEEVADVSGEWILFSGLSEGDYEASYVGLHRCMASAGIEDDAILQLAARFGPLGRHAAICERPSTDRVATGEKVSDWRELLVKIRYLERLRLALLRSDTSEIERPIDELEQLIDIGAVGNRSFCWYDTFDDDKNPVTRFGPTSEMDGQIIRCTEAIDAGVRVDSFGYTSAPNWFAYRKVHELGGESGLRDVRWENRVVIKPTAKNLAELILAEQINEELAEGAYIGTLPGMDCVPQMIAKDLRGAVFLSLLHDHWCGKEGRAGWAKCKNRACKSVFFPAMHEGHHYCTEACKKAGLRAGKSVRRFRPKQTPNEKASFHPGL